VAIDSSLSYAVQSFFNPFSRSSRSSIAKVCNLYSPPLIQVQVLFPHHFPTLSWNFCNAILNASSIIDLSYKEVAYDISTIQSKNEFAVAPHIPHITMNSASTTKAIHEEASGS
jgi:hypothetical protein